MRRSIGTVLICLGLVICCNSWALAMLQGHDPKQVLLVNLVRNSDKVCVYKRDPKDAAKWRKKPSFVVKQKTAPDLLRELRTAEVDKPAGLRLDDAVWRFDFTIGKGKPYSVASDGRILDQRGDASIHLPKSWQDRMK